MIQVQDRHIQELVADYTGTLINRYGICSRLTDSPIEALMAWALWHVADKNGEVFGFTNGNEIPDDVINPVSLSVTTQGRIGKYKADLAILGAQGSKIVVECDGHNFHEKTKQQAQHDKERDRFMQDAGWKVYRFTGGEIYRSPLTCAESVLSSLWRASY